MVHEVVVVGGGIGGLTVAALLAARGVDVCLLERASQPGGVVAGVESFGYTFDPGVGLYPFWEPGEIHDRVFSELPVQPPEFHSELPAYIVRLPDQTEVPLTANEDEFSAALLAAFPECADKALEFYEECAQLSNRSQSSKKHPGQSTSGLLKQIKALVPNLRAPQILQTNNQTVSKRLEGTSPRFQHFIDAQLQILAQASSDTCSFLRAAAVLTIPQRTTFSIQGGAPAVARRLADSIKQSGSRLRLDTPVLRLAYDASGRAIGVDLLSGETVGASRAIVSNLTVWDTYGKLIGLNRTPSEVRKQLSTMGGWGAYTLFLGIDNQAAERLRANRILTIADWVEPSTLGSEASPLMFSAAPNWDPRAPSGKRAVTVVTLTDVEEWFTFHETAEEIEEKDQATLEQVWRRLHDAMPELGGDIEVIETASPLTCYELTRRKLGMIGAPTVSLERLLCAKGTTSHENVFIVGDTNSQCPGIAGVTRSALALANQLTL